MPFGIAETIPPLAGFPPGRTRVRQRHDSYPVVHVFTATGIRAFHVDKWTDGSWRPYCEIGSNTTVKQAPAFEPPPCGDAQ
jgi:hypothetical protein